MFKKRVETKWIFILLIIFMTSNVLAIECGSIPTDGCTISTNTTFISGAYNLPNGFKIVASSIVLDCNGSTFIGDKSNEGIEIYDSTGRNNNTIKNCNLKNYSIGINLKGPHNSNIIINNVLEDNYNGIVFGKTNYYDKLKYNIIKGNNLSNNQYGILLEFAHGNNNITENIITNSSINGIMVGDEGIENIWNNNLYSQGISYQYVNSNYCIKSIPNNYFDGAIGPLCDCFPPISTMFYVNKDIIFCSGIYHVPNTIARLIGSNITLDCNGSTFIGDKSNEGIEIYDSTGRNNNTIKNCNLKNYSIGINLKGPHNSNIIINNVLEDDYNGIVFGKTNYYDKLKYNTIKGNNFSNNRYGILLEFAHGNNNITENIIINSSINGIMVGDEGIENIWNNNLYSQGISYQYVNSNYCIESIPNNYFDGAIGPLCDCFPPISTMFYVNKDIIFCSGIYNVPNTIARLIGSNITLDCNGSTFIGDKSNEGIEIYDSTGRNNNTIKNCNLKNYSIGINLKGPHNYNFIVNNTLEENDKGIYFSKANYYDKLKYNIINDNHLWNNNEGVHLTSGTVTNKIYNNFFRSNTIQAQDEGTNNLWNNSEIGNNWDDYDSAEEGCYDMNQDFICDLPYNISGNAGNKDYLPFVPEIYNGTINIFVTDSNNLPLSGIYAYLNNNGGEIIDNDGFKEFSLKNINSDNNQNIEIKCNDEITFCESKSTKINFNGDIDTLIFICDMCTSIIDLYIKPREIMFKEQSGQTNVSIIVHSANIEASNVNVKLTKSCKGNYSSINKIIPIISSSKNYELSFLENLEGCEKIIFQIDPENLVNEDNEENNFIEKYVMSKFNAYLAVNTGYSYVDSVVKEYLADYVENVSYGESEIKIYIGKNAGMNVIKNKGWLVDNVIKYNGEKEGVPYNGLIAKTGDELYVFGNEIDGDLAVIRKLVEERENYLNANKLNDNMEMIYLGEEDIDAISVFDYLHTDENDEVYRRNNLDFANVVDNVLRRQTFNLAIKRVLTANDNTSLRLKNVNYEMSPEFKSFTNERPVVLSRGLWSNLFSWEGFAQEIAQGKGTSENRDTWLIELIGGPNTECENCPNYNFTDLTDFYWPALIAGVEAYTNKSEIDYVGFSNGCRTALGSLEKYQASGKSNAGYYYDGNNWVLTDMDADVVHTFIGVGCPGAFEGSSYLTEKVNDNPDSVDKLENLGIMHPTIKDVAKKLSLLGYFLGRGDDYISLNLWEDYNNAILNQSDSQFGNFNVKIAQIIYGYGGLNQIGNERDDGMVTATDAEAILDNINASISKAGLGLKLRHDNLPDDKRVQAQIKGILNEND